MKAYKKYKDSGFEWIEPIPENWAIWKVKYIAKVYNGDSLNIDQKKKFESQNLEHRPYVSTKDIDIESGNIDYDNGLRIPKKESLSVAPKESILLCVEGGSAGRKIAFTSQEICFVNKLACFNFSKSKKSKYYLYFLMCGVFKTQFFNSMTGLIGGVSLTVLKNFFVFVPPLPEQRQIAAYLDYKTKQIDRFIANRKKQIELLEEQVASHINRVMSEGIKRNPAKQPTGIPYLPEIPAHWDLRKFVGLTKILTCGLASTPEYVSEEEGVPFLSAQNCRPFRMDLSKYNYIKPELHKQLTKYKKPEKGDVLVTRVGAGIGQACVIDTDLEFSVYVSLTHIRPTKEILSEYIVYFFNTEYSRQLNYEGTVVGGGQGNLNVNNVAKYKIPLPPIDEQKEIVCYLDEKRQEIGELISKYQKQIDLMQEYKTSLISKAVTGKIDVREWQPKQTLKETV